MKGALYETYFYNKPLSDSQIRSKNKRTGTLLFKHLIPKNNPLRVSGKYIYAYTKHREFLDCLKILYQTTHPKSVTFQIRREDFQDLKKRYSWIERFEQEIRVMMIRKEIPLELTPIRFYVSNFSIREKVSGFQIVWNAWKKVKKETLK